MKIRMVISAGVVGIILISVLGISLSSSETTHENKLRIAYFPNIGHAIPVVGIENGLFAEYLGDDVTIETRVFDSGPQAIEALLDRKSVV